MAWSCLLEAELEPDPVLEKICNDCGLCAEICPVNALAEPCLNQQSCWDYAFGDNEDTKYWEISCHKCRDICPYNLGSENKARRE